MLPRTKHCGAAHPRQAYYGRSAYSFHPITRNARWEQWTDLTLAASRYYDSLSMSGPSLLSDEAIAEMSRYTHTACWRRLHPLRCPGCGIVGRRVGADFEAPSQRKDKAWAVLEEKMDNDSNFDKCTAESLDWVYRNHVRRQDKLASEPYLAEKRRRIEELRKAVELGVRTEEEERRLAAIRGRKVNDKGAA